MDVDRLQAKEASPGSTRLKQRSEACHRYQRQGVEDDASKLILESTMKGAKNYLKMSNDPTLSEATSKLISSDLKDIGEATRKLADHVIKIGVSGGFITTCLQWIACFAAIYLLILDRTNWRTKILTSLLVPYIFLTLPEWLFGILHGDIGKWITLVGVVLRLFFREHYPEYLELPGSLLLLVVVAPNFVTGYVRIGWIGVIVYLVIGCYLLQEHIRASGGFKNAFTKSNGISNTIGIVLLFIFPIWAIIGLLF
ncbi:cold-regulated 413 plasma membrane protein 2 [Lactuca sativa]|uniref:cold-regulated 413 plasma membrane protein 2 n=1 Tax=Lactuca sativa TaxID=4236 RepID=UPI0022AFE007|nr:cold-regulated 413 plasma membrane protein 2 [Lactuca sativa]